MLKISKAAKLGFLTAAEMLEPMTDDQLARGRIWFEETANSLKLVDLPPDLQSLGSHHSTTSSLTWMFECSAAP